MALWLIRAGKDGSGENRFLEDGRIYWWWGRVDYGNVTNLDRERIKDRIREANPDFSENKISNGAGQSNAFINEMKPGDWVCLPSKLKSAIHIGEIKGPYQYDPGGEWPHKQYREVQWIETDIPRSNFGQDVLSSLGALMTLCRIKRNDAERRVRAMAQTGWKMDSKTTSIAPSHPVDLSQDEDAPEEFEMDLAELARDQIAKRLIAIFKGHRMAELVDAILRAQGYTTYKSPPGPDKGVDILAAPGLLGFGQPSLCVQVKSSESPLDRPTLDQLVGTMKNFGADKGLLVSWGGFKSSVNKEEAKHFLDVRLWGQKELITQLLEHYDKLDESLQAELPLQRIWTVAVTDDSD